MKDSFEVFFFFLFTFVLVTTSSSNMNISVPIGTEVSSVAFSFYEPTEIRKISVKQIVNPVLFDTLGHPTKGGLYDPALGPYQKTQM
jgi:DNA-directed RNA polymerase I subunit RPA1